MNAPVRIHRQEQNDDPSSGRYRLRVTDYVMLHEKGSFQAQETELIDGEVFVLSPEWRPHFRIKSELLFRLRLAVEGLALPFFVGTEGSIALSDTDMPRPDILLTSEPDGDGPVPRASVPLLVEIASTTVDDDLGSKAVRYAAASIPEYWVVDLQSRKVHVMWSPEAQGYAKSCEVVIGEPLRAQTIDGLRIDTAGLL